MLEGAFAGRLWLIRHGETEGQSSVRFHGSNDVPLADAGRAQMRALAPLLRGLRPDLLLHSPLRRAAESAAILVRESGMRPVRTTVDARLREISFGECEGMTREEIERLHPLFWQQHERGEVDAFPGGESRAAFRRRVGEAVAEIAQLDIAGDVVVVAHRGIVRVGLRTLLAVPDDQGDPFKVQLGSLTVVRRDAGRAAELELYDFVP